MKSPYTSRQGQFLAFVHHYSTLHGRPPSEAEMGQFFQVTPPSIHQMVLTLERRGLIGRTPGEARSIQLKLPPEALPTLRGASANANISSPAPQAEHPQLGDAQAALAHLGKIQIEDLFAYDSRNPLNDSEYLPLLDTLIESFRRAGLSATRVKNLRRHACELYHRYCQEAEPESTFEANLELMLSYLPASAQTRWSR